MSADHAPDTPTWCDAHAVTRVQCGCPFDGPLRGAPSGSKADTSEDLLAGVRSGEWLDAQHFAPLAYAVPPLLPEGFTLFAGSPKTGKSWLSLSLLLSVASGGRAFGCIPVGEPRPVLYLALEDGDRRLQERTRMLLNGEPIPRHFHFVTTVRPGMIVATMEAWLERHPDTAMVCLDTFGKVAPPQLMGESAYQRDYRVGGQLKRTVDECPGTSLVVIHHDRKAASDDFVESVSGTNGLAGSADTIVMLNRARMTTDGVLKVTGRDVDESEYAIRMVEGAWLMHGGSLDYAREAADTIRRQVKADGLSDTMRAVVQYVNGQPEPVRAAQVAESLGDSPDLIKRYLSRAVDSGLVSRPSRGLYAPPMRVPSVPLSHSSDSGSRDGTEGTLGTGLTCRACLEPMEADWYGDGRHPACA